MLEQFVKNCSPWEGLALEQIVEDCLHGRDPALEQGRSARSPALRRKERQRQGVMN